MIKRKSWQDYQKEIADDHYYYARSCIRQNFFPGSEKLFIDMLRNDLGKDLTDDPLHSSCTGIGYHSDIVPLETIMTAYYRDYDWCAFCTSLIHANVMDAAPEWF